MKNKKLFRKKLGLSFNLILRLLIFELIAAFIFYMCSYFFADEIARFLYNRSLSLYHLISNNLNLIFILTLSIVFVLVVYKFISRKLDNLDELYDSLDYVLSEESKAIELDSELNTFSEKLNQIKYEYILSQKRAKEAEEKKANLIMYMAHDLKTPLTSVIGYLSLMSDEKEISNETRDKYTNIALDKALRLENLTNEFFEITRYNLTDIAIDKKQIDIVMLLEQLKDEFYPSLEERNLKLEINGPQKLYYMADGEKLARAFSNLLKNSIKYSYEGTTIEVFLKDMPDFIELRFINKGEDIPKYKLEKIFDKFYRASDARETKSGGAGLGLAITKEIIELHGGTIYAKSKDETIEFIVKLKK